MTRRRTVLLAVVAATAISAPSVLVPLGPGDGPTPVDGMRTVDLPTGSRLAYARVLAVGGSRAAPLIVLHGGPGVADMAGDLAFFGRLADGGRDVIAYDQVGAGHSERLADPTEYSLERDVADLAAFLDGLGVERVVLVGHSYGATVAAAFAATRPAAVEALVLLAPGAIRPHARAYGTGMVDRLDTGQRAGLYLDLLQPRGLVAWLLTQADPRAARAFVGDAEMDRRFDANYARSAPGLYCHPPATMQLPSGLGAYTNAVPRRVPDLRPALAAVDAPALIAKPQCDYLPWTFGSDLAAALPNASLVYLERAGHALYAERPGVVLALLRAFLEGAPLPIAPRTDLSPPASLAGPVGAP